MNKLLNDALRAKGYAGPDIKMVLTDVEDPNGPYYTDTLTNMVVFDRKQLSNSNRDEILNALGHEFGHYSKEDDIDKSQDIANHTGKLLEDRTRGMVAKEATEDTLARIIGYDSVVYKVLSKIDEDDLKYLEFEDWDGCLVIEISIYNYPDEIRNLDNEIIWTKENIKKEHIDIINQKNKKLEEQKKRGREYFKYLDELEILRREKVNTPKREEELIKKIEEREEAGKRYAEYKRSLKGWIEYMKKYSKMFNKQ